MPKFELTADHYAAITDLILAIRDARAAFEAAKGNAGEWDALAREIKRGHYGCAPLPTLIDAVRSWSAGWQRRANARTQRPRETLSGL